MLSFLPLSPTRRATHAEGMKRVLSLLFRWGLDLNAALTRSPLRRLESHLTTPFFVWVTRRIRGPAPSAVGTSAEALGREWERLLGAGPYGRVTRVDEASQTAFGEIRGRCPLRGTGDVAACHRLMAYDRGLVAPLGARLVVLASQAQPGRTFCEIAIRPGGLPNDDLVPAHRLVR